MNKQYLTSLPYISVGVLGSRLSERVVAMLRASVPQGVRVLHVPDQNIPWSAEQMLVTVMTDFDHLSAGDTYPHWTYYLNDFRTYVATRASHTSLIANYDDPSIATMLREASCRVHKVRALPRLIEMSLALTMKTIEVVLTLPTPKQQPQPLSLPLLQKSA
jgi:hypothetical protein